MTRVCGESKTNPTGGSGQIDRCSGDGRATGAVPVARESDEPGLFTHQRRVRAVTLAATLTVLAAPAPAQALTWDDLGGTLKKACTYVNGGGQSGGIQYGGDRNLQWVCTVSSMYTFISNNIINGDWKGFAQDVMGRYVTELASYLTGQLGLGSLNETVDQLNDMMRGTYRDFRNAMLGAMKNALLTRGQYAPEDNQGLPGSTPGGLADYFADVNPIFNASQTAGRMGQTIEKFKAADTAMRVKKVQEQSIKAIEDTVAPAMSNAMGTIGNGVQTGQADELYKTAESAVSTREVAVAQAKVMTEAMKSDAVYNTSVLSLLSEIAKQGVLNNSELAQARARAEAQQTDNENELKQYLEQQAEQTLNEARDVAQQVDRNVQTASSMLDPDVSTTDILEDMAP